MARCDLEHCPVNTGGICLEGRGENCPHLLKDKLGGEAEINTASMPTQDWPESSTEILYSGTPLEIQEAREFSRNGRSVVVALVGLSECGKTSLIARLHQQFLAGPVGGYAFVGSRTLLRFEELNWFATIESGVGQPLMGRSSRSFDNTLLHLTVQGVERGDHQRTELLINDISGETVTDAVAAQSVCEGLLAVARADFVVAVADGGALADLDICHDHAGKIRDFVQRLVQSGQIDRRTILHLVVSKQDLLRGGEAVAAQLEADFKRHFADHVGELRFWRIAARPTDGSHPTEQEIAKLFASWIEHSLRYPVADRSTLPMIEWERDFGRFGAAWKADPQNG